MTMMDKQINDRLLHSFSCRVPKSLQSCPTLCDPMDYSGHRILLCPWDSPGENNWADCLFLFQGIFLTPDIKPRSPLSLVLTCRFCIASTTWKAQYRKRSMIRLWLYWPILIVYILTYPKDWDILFSVRHGSHQLQSVDENENIHQECIHPFVWLKEKVRPEAKIFGNISLIASFTKCNYRR